MLQMMKVKDLKEGDYLLAVVTCENVIAAHRIVGISSGTEFGQVEITTNQNGGHIHLLDFDLEVLIARV